MFSAEPKALPNRIMVSVSAATLTVAALVACTTTDLTPAPDAERAPGNEHAAVDSVKGVRAVVESQAWTGDPAIVDKLTPLHLRIENNSDKPIRIRYNEFALIGPAGQYFSALPPLAAQTDIADASAFTDEVIDDPAFQHNAFFIAPAYRYAYSSIPVWAHDFHHDPFYHETYHDIYHQAYSDLNISAAKFHAQALPEGVVDSGGSVSGFLYFEHVDPELPRAQFRADVVEAHSGRTIGTLSIPFTVTGDD
jgi:hypothetical protein